MTEANSGVIEKTPEKLSRGHIRHDGKILWTASENYWVTPEKFAALKEKERLRFREMKRNRDYKRSKPDLRYDPVRRLLKNTRTKARSAGKEFSLLPKDISIPEFCPVANIALDTISSGRATDHSPTVVLINKSKGYVPGNIRVISMRAWIDSITLP